MPFTGERLTSGISGQTEIEHLHRYLLARHLSRNKKVVDVASGEGYGAALLAQVASSVVGIEIAAEAVRHATASYRRPNLHFAQGDARSMPVANRSADLVVSFETIEHFVEHEAFLAEIRRVLRPDGTLVISTPDQENYSPTDTPANPFHMRELAKEEFSANLEKFFKHVHLLRQRPLIGSVLLPSSPYSEHISFERRGDHIECSIGLPRPQYLVAVASDQPPHSLPCSLYIDTSQIDNLVNTDGHMARAALEAARSEADALHQELRADREAHTAARDAFAVELAAAHAQASELKQQLHASRASAAALERGCERAEGAGIAARRQLAECRERASRQELLLAATLSSTSWRVTAPLRALVHSLRGR
jgi:SAM-dependent methyltransferase